MTERRQGLSERDRELRRREWLMIYLPLAAGVALVVALVVAISVLGLRQPNLGGDPASAWGDTGAIIVIMQVAVISLLPLILLVALCVLVIWLITKLHPLLKSGQVITKNIYQKTELATDKLVAAFSKPYSLSARVRAIRQFMWRKNV